MAAEAELQLARVGVQNAVENGDVHARLALAAEYLVRISEALLGRLALQRDGLQERAAYGHKQRCRNSLAGNIADHEPQTLRVDQEEVIEVATDDARGRISA